MSSSCAWATVASNMHTHAYMPRPPPHAMACPPLAHQPKYSFVAFVVCFIVAKKQRAKAAGKEKETGQRVEGSGQRAEGRGKRAPAASCVSDVSASISPKQIDKLDLDFVVVVVSLRFSQGEEGLALKRKCNICWQRHANRFLNARVYSPRTLQCAFNVGYIAAV